MKISHYAPIAIAAIAFNPSIALGEVLQHAVTFKLTLEREADEVMKESSSSTNFSKMKITEKVSNKELLGFYLERGIIEEISGWSIVGASFNDYEFGGDILGVYLVKKGEEPINVSDDFYTEDEEEIEVRSYNWTFDNETELRKGTETYTYESDFYFDFEDEEGEFSFELATISTVTKIYDEEKNIGLFSSQIFSDASGSFYDDYNDENGVIRGSITIGKGSTSEILLIF